MIRILPAGRLIAISSELEISAAVAGLGLINTFEEILEPALDAGRLTRVLQDGSVEFPGPSLYYQSRRHMRSKLRAFVDFLRAEMIG